MFPGEFVHLLVVASYYKYLLTHDDASVAPPFVDVRAQVRL